MLSAYCVPTYYLQPTLMPKMHLLKELRCLRRAIHKLNINKQFKLQNLKDIINFYTHNALIINTEIQSDLIKLACDFWVLKKIFLSGRRFINNYNRSIVYR